MLVLWAAAAALTEAAILERIFFVRLRRATDSLELVANYAIGVLVVGLVVAAATRLARRSRGGAPAGRVIEACLGIGLLGAVLWNATVAFRLGGRHASLGAALLAVLVLVLVTLAAIAFARATPKRAATVRIGLALYVGAAMLINPLRRGDTASGVEVAHARLTAAPRNVLVILTDTLRSDYLGCYGQALPTSPTIDSLAVAGARFTDAIGAASWTLPSTASLMTGWFPASHGADRPFAAIRPGAPRLASIFAGAGFRTAAFSENAMIIPRYGFGDGFDHYWSFWFPWVTQSALAHRVHARAGLPWLSFTEKREYPESFEDPRDLRWDARVTAERVSAWIDEHASERFFVYVHFMGPHGPYGPPEYLLPGAAPRVRLADHPKSIGEAFPLGTPGAPVSDDERAFITTMYAADVRYVDSAVARIVDTLRRRNLLDDTLILFTSDHGEEFFEHSGWNHGASAFREITDVPLIVAGAGIRARGEVIGDRVRTIDVAPTLVELAGLVTNAPFAGHSLAGRLTGSPAPQDAPPAFVDACVRRPSDGSVAALVTNAYKVVRVRAGDRDTVMLFDRRSDPTEEHDLAPTLPATRDSLLRGLYEWERVAGAHGGSARDLPVDPTMEDALRSLGYIN